MLLNPLGFNLGTRGHLGGLGFGGGPGKGAVSAACPKLPDKEYGEHEFSFREIYFMNGFDEYVGEDHIRRSIK